MEVCPAVAVPGVAGAALGLFVGQFGGEEQRVALRQGPSVALLRYWLAVPAAVVEPWALHVYSPQRSVGLSAAPSCCPNTCSTLAKCTH